MSQIYEHYRMFLKHTAFFPQFLWLGYCMLLGFLSWFLFGSLLELPHDLDDIPALRDNTKIGEVPLVLLHGFYHPSGRPVGHLLRWLVYLVWGNDIRVFHALSVVIHTANAFLVAFLGSRINLNPRTYFIAGVLFLFHVAHFKAVHHVAALEYLLAAMWSMSALVALSAYLRQSTGLRLAALYSTTTLAVASHIAASALLPLAAFYVWTKTRNDRIPWRAFLPLLALVLLILYLLISQATTQRVPTTTGRAFSYMSDSSLPDLVINASRMLLWLTAQLFVFAHMVLGYLWVVYSWQLLVGVLVYSGFFYLLLRHRASPLTLCLAWSIVFLLPFVLQDEQTVRDVPGPSRYLYLASVGSSLVLARLLAALVASRKPWVQGSSVLIAAAALVSSSMNLKSMEALSYYTAAQRHRSEGDLEQSRQLAEKALAGSPEILPLEETYTCLLLSQLALDSEQARLRTQELLLIDPESPTLGLFQTVFTSEGEQVDWQEAELHLRSFSRDALISTVFSHWARNQTHIAVGKALLSLQRSLSFDPNNTQALFLYGALLVDMGNLDGLRYYVRAVDLDGRPDRFNVLIAGLKRSRRLGESIDFVAQLERTAGSIRFVKLAQQASD